jgi:formylglycine-generating enzyme required for sulfatase activity
MKNLLILSALICFCCIADAQTGAKNNQKKSPPVDLTRFSLVDGGTFTMGSAKGIEPHEKPEHQVSLKSFYISKYEVTFDDFDRYTDSAKMPRTGDMSWGRGKRPAIIVSWLDAVAYCNWLSKQEKLQPCYAISGRDIKWLDTASGYRLPTEAEWEYAARGGDKSKKTIYAGADKPDDAVWYNANSGNKTQPVGQKSPNELGLYDMNGNVWEWVWDVYDATYYQKSPASDPTGPAMGDYRVMRGGAWYNNVNYVTVYSRQYHTPDFRQNSVGFRIARNKP